MSELNDWNAKIIAEFRANDGKVGGMFEGGAIVLLHHVGRTSGRDYVSPLAYFTEPDTPDTIYIVASAAGAPKNPQWYANVTSAGRAHIERGHATGGVDTYDVSVEKLPPAERDRLWIDIVEAAPGFADYATKTEGIRTIPVLALRRAA